MQEEKGLKYKLGMACILLAVISPLIGLSIPFLGLSEATTTTLVAFFMVGGPEIFLILGASLAGKEAVDTIKSKFFAYAGKARYQTGLVLLLLSILANWIFAYIDLIGAHNLSIDTQLIITLCIDIVSIVSIFLMGPEFLGKLKRLVTWEGQG